MGRNRTSTRSSGHDLPRRERQILDLLHQQGEGSARDVLEGLEDAPSYSAVRAMLARMVERGVVVQRQAGRRYLYAPAEATDQAGRSALRHLVSTFFEDSPVQAASALLGMSKADLDDDELAALKAMVDRFEAGHDDDH